LVERLRLAAVAALGSAFLLEEPGALNSRTGSRAPSSYFDLAIALIRRTLGGA